ncbi:MAG: hypothetical protein SFY69_12580 [Planctomycetota bacterium]|nr:hypothetical protein [Planctomycetota bacterium]
MGTGGTPLLVIVVGALLVLAGVALLVVGLVGRRRAGRACRACGYDLGAGVGLTCPECGRVHAGERELVPRRRVRWKWVVLGLLLLVAGAGATMGWRHVRRAFYAVMPEWRVRASHTIGACTITRYRPFDPEGWGERLVVRHADAIVADIQDHRVGFGNDAPPALARDVTNDGVPDLVVEGYSGGAHCCWTYIVIQLGDAPRELASIDAPDPGRFELDEQHGLVVFRGTDPIWNYWNASYAASARPDVVLLWRDGAFRLAPHLMRTPEPGEDAVRASIDLAREESASSGQPAFLETVRWLYEGHPRVAWRVYDEGSPGISAESTAAFRSEIERTLRQSRYWPDLRVLTGGEP